MGRGRALEWAPSTRSRSIRRVAAAVVVVAGRLGGRVDGFAFSKYHVCSRDLKAARGRCSSGTSVLASWGEIPRRFSYYSLQAKRRSLRARAHADGNDDSFDATLDGEDFLSYLEDDDMGLGVSNTVKKKARTPRPEEVEGRENVILEIATGAQEVADSFLPDDEFDKYRKKESGEQGAGASVRDTLDDDDGMGVSETVTPAKRKEALRGDDFLSEAVSKMQGGDQMAEMERMAAKDVQRSQMEQRGLSPEQIAAYLGENVSLAPKSKAQVLGDKAVEAFQKAAFEDSGAWRQDDALLQVAPSSSLVKLDSKGEPYLDRFVYVDEYTCIGCTHCSHVAPGTFFMEDEYGRARVYQQGRDTEESVRDAIMTCPVDCIHYVDWPELKRLEEEREGIEINFKAKLVGNDHDNSRNGMQTISGNQGMRCDNCPSKGCYNCPMFSVGFNPEYQKRQEERKAKRAAQQKKERDESTGQTRVADL